MVDIGRKKSIFGGSGLNYLYKISADLEKYLVLGTLVRAVGHGMVVKVISEDKEIVRLLKELKFLLNDKMLFVNEDDSEKKLKILVVDGSENDLGYWRSLYGDSIHIVAINVAGDFDLISEVSSAKLNKNGVVAITGGGKGKTTIGLGLALLRSLGDIETLFVSWLKEKKNEGLSWSIGEHFFEKKINKRLFKIETTGLGFFGSPNLDRVKGENSYLSHKTKAYDGVEMIRKKVENNFSGVIVLDEFADTVKEIAGNIEYPLIDLKDFRYLLETLVDKKIEVVVTGRRVTEHWSNLVGESIEIKEIKHQWNSMGVSAVPGLDF